MVRRVEIEDHLIGQLELVRPAGERVYLDAGLIGQVDECGRLVADDVLDHPALLVHLDAADPVREVRGRVLLEEPLAGQAVGITHHGDRPVPQPRQHPAGDIGVVPGQVLLGDPVVGEENLPRVGERHRDPADGNLFGHVELPLTAP